MKKNLLILLTACCLMSAFSCKKKFYDPDAPPLLPEISSEGRHTFGFMFGKDVWVPNFSSLPALSANYSASSGKPRLYIICRTNSTRTNGIDDFTLEYFNSNITPGTYPIDNLTAKVVVNISYPGDKTREYRLDEVGTITFSRWDLVNRIASGTFSMTLKDVASGEKVSITQGRFDVKLSN